LSDPVQGRGAGGSWKALLLALLAAALTASLYWLRVDSAMYFLHGAEAQGLLLAKALASGQGFVEISLPGSPAHVREPPLFYLCLAGLIKLFGFRLYPMKVFVWAGYVLSAGLGVWLFSKRAPAFIAFFGLMTVMSSPELFRFFTGPKSDIPYTALSLGAILALEWLAFQVLDRGRKETRRKILPYVFAAALCVAAPGADARGRRGNPQTSLLGRGPARAGDSGVLFMVRQKRELVQPLGLRLSRLVPHRP